MDRDPPTRVPRSRSLSQTRQRRSPSRDVPGVHDFATNVAPTPGPLAGSTSDPPTTAARVDLS
eukprot:4805251-Heterocapsa_arctica.AAC.1